MTARIDFHELSEEACTFRVVSIEHLGDLEHDILDRWNHHQFDEEFAQTYLPRFRFVGPEQLKAKSIIVVAMPRPPTKAVFNWRGKKQSFILPPTYTAYDEKRLRIENIVAETVGKLGFKIATPQLPLKLLAVRSGLAEYGRNNITYADGMGSFMRLTAVYSDMPCETDQWQEPSMMKRCKNCELCRNACPTGAISKDRFLLHAEKCLTYHNEKEGSIPFPEWIKPEWHNCIVGCIRCQNACPENKPYLNKIGECAEFTEEETALLLAGTPKEQIPSSTTAKMQLLSLTDYFKELPRNLSVLIK